MGASSSSQDQISLQHLEKLCSDKRIPLVTQFWHEQIEPLCFDLSRIPPEQVEEHIRRLSENLARNNGKTKNLNTLIKYLSARLTFFRSDLEKFTQIGDEDAMGLMNLLFLCRIFLKYIIETQQTSIREHFQPGSKDDFSEEKLPPSEEISEKIPETISMTKQTDTASIFVKTLSDSLIDFPFAPETEEVFVELTSILLVLTSTQMYLDDNFFLDILMAQEISYRAPQLLQKLLKIIHTRLTKPVPQPPDRPSIFIRLGLSIIKLPLTLLSFFYKLGQTVGDKQNPTLTTNCANLLLVLTHQINIGVLTVNTPVTTSITNFPVSSPRPPCLSDPDDIFLRGPYHQHLTLFFDSTLSEGKVGATEVRFSELYELLLKSINAFIEDPKSYGWCFLLTYTLIHKNKLFSQYLFSKSDLEDMVIPLLRSLYTTKNLASNHASVLLILLLLLTQDGGFCVAAHRTPIAANQPWFLEASTAGISLGSLMMSVLFRTAEANAITARQAEFHSYVLATIINLSTSSEQISEFTSKQIVGLLEDLTSSLEMLEQERKELEANTEDESEKQDQFKGLEEDKQYFGDFQRLILEMIALQANHKNPHVLLTLLKNGGSALVDNWLNIENDDAKQIKTLLVHLESEIKDVNLPRGELLQPVTEVSKRWSSKDLTTKQTEKMRFLYQECQDSSEFFLPYIWQITSESLPFSFASRTETES